MATKNTTITVNVAGSQNYLPASKTIDVSIIIPDWLPKTWNGFTNFTGVDIWTDGTDTYYSGGDYKTYILNKNTSTWSQKDWNYYVPGDDPIYRINYGRDIWTDGTNIYYSGGSSAAQYILNKSTSTWTQISWKNFTSPQGQYIWTDGTNIYYSRSSSNNYQYILNKSTSTWENKTWNGELTAPNKQDIWIYNNEVYYGHGSQYVLDKSTSTWVYKDWGQNKPTYAENVWTDGTNLYYSSDSYGSIKEQYIFNKTTLKWENKTWNGLVNFDGVFIWTDGENIYYSKYYGGKYDHYVLNKS